MSLFTMMVGIFIHPEVVIEPGLDQLGAAYLILVATLGLTFSVQANYAESRLVDRGVRLVLAAVSIYILISFNDTLSTILSIAVLATIAYWLVYRRTVEETGIEEVVIDDKAALATAGNPALSRMN